MKCILVKNNSIQIDLTNILSEVEFGGSVEQACRTMRIAVANNGTKIDVGDTIGYIDDNIHYVGQVHENTNKNKQEVLRFEVVDYMSHWTRSFTTKIVNSTAESVAKEFCNYMGMLIGNVATTGIATGQRVYENKSLYSIIKDLYDRASSINGKEYVIRTYSGYFNVFEKGEIIDYIIGDRINLDNVTSEDNITDLVNKVIAYNDNNKLVKEKTNYMLGVVGLYQQVAAEDDNIDKILTDVKRTLVVTGVGDNACQAGKYVRFIDGDTNQMGLYEILEDEHRISSSGHKMTLRLKFLRLMKNG